VALRLGDRVGGEIARCATAVFDDDRLLPVRAQPVGHHAPDDVSRASGRVADQHAHGFRRILLRVGSESGEAKSEHQARQSHSKPPFIIPVKAGIQLSSTIQSLWIPACAGMTAQLVHRCENIFFPAAGISAVRISPLSESVMWSVLRFGPPKAMLVIRR